MKIVEKPLARSGKVKRPRDVRMVTSALGKRVKADRLDAGSASFGDELLESFARTVNRVRRENKALFGRPDGAGDDNKA